MKKILLPSMIAVFAVCIFGCSTVKKYAGNISISDLVKVSDIIAFSFGSGPDGPFEVEPSESPDSKVVIKNDTDRTITVKAKGKSAKKFVVKSGKSDMANLKPGDYHFTATAPNVKGCEGDVTLKGHNQYTWLFIIK